MALGLERGSRLGRMSPRVALSNQMKPAGPGDQEAAEKGEELSAEPGTCLFMFLPGANLLDINSQTYIRA